MGIAEVLTAAFVALKLMGYIDWRWIFVLLPEIIAISIYVIIFMIAIVGNHIANKKKEKRRREFWKHNAVRGEDFR